MKLCHYQDICIEFETGDNKPPNHDVRSKYPCKHWLAMDCQEIDSLERLQMFCTREPMACNLEKIRRIKGGLK